MACAAMYGLPELVTWSRPCSGDYVYQEPPWSQFWVAAIALMRSKPHFWLQSFWVSHGTLSIIQHSSNLRSSQSKTWLGVGCHCQNNWYGFQLDSWASHGNPQGKGGKSSFCELLRKWQPDSICKFSKMSLYVHHYMSSESGTEGSLSICMHTWIMRYKSEQTVLSFEKGGGMMNGLTLPLKNGPEDWEPLIYKYFPKEIFIAAWCLEDRLRNR